MKLHGIRVGERKRQRGACATGRTDRAEEIRALIALVGGLAWPRSSSCPLPYEAVLLADPRLVLEPDLDGLALRNASQVGAQRSGEVFLNTSIVLASCAG